MQLSPSSEPTDREAAALRAELDALKIQLAETFQRLKVAEATVQAIRSSEVNAVVVQQHDNSRVLTLAASEKFYLQLAQEFANVGTWEIEFATNQANISEGLKQTLGIDAAGPVPLDELWPYVHPDDRDRVRGILENARQSGNDQYYLEFRIQAVDGTVRWMAGKGAILHSAEGAPSRLVGVNLDITERKLSEKALEESERAFRELADSMPQIVWTAKPDGRVEYFNRRWYEYTGMTDAVLQREERLLVVHPEDRERARLAWDQAMLTGKAMEVEYRFRESQSGNYRWHLGRAVPISNEQGEILRWFGTATDIHDQKSLQNSLRDADHRKDQFLAMLAHELRNPLSPLMIAADLFASEPALSPQLREMADVMIRQTTQLKRLIDDLLDVSRISTGRLELKRERVDLREAIEAALDVSRPLIDSSGHELIVDVPPRSIFVQGDKTRLAQVVGNLLINSAKYTPTGGHIRLTVQSDGDLVNVAVEDDGIGIPKAMLSNVFNLFTQVDSSRTRSQSGLGIGLTLVKTLVEMHGGDVSAESGGPGLGSRFTVRLPAMDRVSKADAAPEGAGEKSAATRRRILVIDDNQSASYLLGKLLTKLEQDVQVEQSALRALSCIHEFQPDIVISDIAMPEFSGYQLAREIRSLPLPKQPILVALTGYGQEDDRQASLDAGFDIHVTKPIDIATLRTLLQSN
ncbi:MAG TPA: PAS domain-containing protein [Caulifigura sp.]|jgi:PAS domain S-box-containing protein|nr:PAS domain-containing protein [Caulifigura sp.]